MKHCLSLILILAVTLPCFGDDVSVKLQKVDISRLPVLKYVVEKVVSEGDSLFKGEPNIYFASLKKPREEDNVPGHAGALLAITTHFPPEMAVRYRANHPGDNDVIKRRTANYIGYFEVNGSIVILTSKAEDIRKAIPKTNKFKKVVFKYDGPIITVDDEIFWLYFITREGYARGTCMIDNPLFEYDYTPKR